MDNLLDRSIYGDDYEDYDNLGNIFDDFKSKVLNPLWTAIKPSIPAVTERMVAPRPALPPNKVITASPVPQQIIIREKTKIPMWAYIGGAVAIGVLVLPKLLRR